MKKKKPESFLTAHHKLVSTLAAGYSEEVELHLVPTLPCKLAPAFQGQVGTPKRKQKSGMSQKLLPETRKSKTQASQKPQSSEQYQGTSTSQELKWDKKQTSKPRHKIFGLRNYYMQWGRWHLGRQLAKVETSKKETCYNMAVT